MLYDCYDVYLYSLLVINHHQNVNSKNSHSIIKLLNCYVSIIMCAEHHFMQKSHAFVIFFDSLTCSIPIVITSG